MPKKKFDVEAKISVKDDASKKVKKLDSGFKRLTKTIKASAVAQAAAFGAVVLAIRAATRAVGAFIRAANKQEDAINALEGALAPLGDRVGEVSKALQDQASALQKVTRFGDEEIIEAQALIASFVKEEDQIKAATKATLDLAEAKGFSLVSAADLVSKTLGSSTNALTRYGIEVTGAVGSTERLASLTENVATVFGGRATKATETFSGAVQQLSNVIGDELLESLGSTVTENNELIENIRTLTAEIPNFTAGIKNIAAAFTESNIVQNEFVGGLSQKLGVLLDVTLGGYVTLAAAISAYGENTENVKAIEVERLNVLQRLNARFTETNESLLEQLGLGGTYIATLVKIAKATESAADAQKRLAKEAKETSDAMDKLGDALGEITSIELASEITEIEEALEKARETTGGLGREFERLEDVAASKIESLRRRIDGLKDGVGDLGDEAERTAGQTDDMARSFDDASRQADSLSTGVRSTSAALRSAASDAGGAASQFDRLARSAEAATKSQERIASAPTLFGRTSLSRTTRGESTINTGFWTGSYTITTLPDGTRIYS